MTGRRLRLCGTLFADCTGDAAVGFLAGAECEMTAKGHMGPTNLWSVVDTGKPSPFPRCPWACDLSDKPFPSDLQMRWGSGFGRAASTAIRSPMPSGSATPTSAPCTARGMP